MALLEEEEWDWEESLAALRWVKKLSIALSGSLEDFTVESL